MRQVPMSAASSANSLVRLWDGWNHFWFNPADPTILGLVRICAGMLVLYVHLAYCFDLQGFFGKEAWLDLRTLNELRLKAPIVAPSLDWDEAPPIARPSNPAEQEYVQRYERRWGMPPPPPFPRNEAEAKAIDDYREMWDVDPRMATFHGRPLWSVWYDVVDPAWMRIVHGLVLTAMFLFTIGFCTRVTSVLTWLAVLSYIQRAPTTLFGMDTIMIVVVLYLMIGPSGAALSVDRWLVRYWKTRRALRRHLPVPDLWKPEPSVSANLAVRLMQIHICMIYMASGLSKLLGQSWWSGTAVWMTMANYEFSPMDIPPYLVFLKYLCQNRVIWEIFVTGGTLFTLAFEITFGILVWLPRMRWLMILSAVLLHTGIAIFMGLVMFSLMMMALLLSFISSGTVRRLFRLDQTASPEFKLYVNSREPRQVRGASLVHALDLWQQVELLELPSRPRASGNTGSLQSGLATASVPPLPSKIMPEAPRLQLLAKPEGVLSGHELFRRLAGSLPLFRPLGWMTWVPGVEALARLRYGPQTSGQQRHSSSEEPEARKREQVSPVGKS